MVSKGLSSKHGLSMAKKLLQAAALAVVLLPSTSAMAGATPIEHDCTFDAGGGFEGCVVGPNGGALYQWEDYSVELSFVTQLTTFTVAFTDFQFTQSEISGRFIENFQGYEPLPICISVDCSNPYVEFRVTSSPLPVQNVDYLGQYSLYFYWLAGTNSQFPNPQVLHDLSGTDSQFDTLITIPGSYTTEPPGCVFDPDGCGPVVPLTLLSQFDPAVGGRDDMFTGFTLSDQTVPEPATLLLLGSGISAIAYRRRRRR